MKRQTINKRQFEQLCWHSRIYNFSNWTDLSEYTAAFRGIGLTGRIPNFVWLGWLAEYTSALTNWADWQNPQLHLEQFGWLAEYTTALERLGWLAEYTTALTNWANWQNTQLHLERLGWLAEYTTALTNWADWQNTQLHLEQFGWLAEYTTALGVVHNCHHFHERTQRTVGGEGVKGDRTLF